MGRAKTLEEIAAIEETQRATEAAMSAVIEYLRTEPIPTAEDAHAIIDKVLAEHDCESPTGHIVAGDEQAVGPHEKGHGPIAHGKAIVIDIFPRSKKNGFYADMTRTVCIGKPSAELQKMYEAVSQAQDLAIAMLKPGADCKLIQDAVEKYFMARGYETSGKGKEFAYEQGFVHGLGHGVGREIHETPHISRKSTDFLQAGDVVTVEPGLYYKNIGGIRLEDLLLVTGDGYKNLTRYEKRFVL